MENTETYFVKRETTCLKNGRDGEVFNRYCNIPSHGWSLWELLEGLEYDITNLKLIENKPLNDTFYKIYARSRVDEKEVTWSNYYHFELWDEKGFIADYKVKQSDFEENIILQN